MRTSTRRKEICPNCFSTDTHLIDVCYKPVEARSENPARPHEWVTLQDANLLYACNTCFLWFRSPRPSGAELEEIYDELPLDHWGDELGTPHAWSLVGKTLREEFAKSPQPSVLDVGAFSGGLLKSLPSTWKKFAIEPSESAGARLRQDGVNVVGRYVQETKAKPTQYLFDAITMIDVLEHIETPTQVIKKLAKMLKPSGIILLSTATTDHWSWRLLGGRNWYLHTVLHLCFGSKAYFHSTSKRLNLDCVRIVRHSHQPTTVKDRIFQSVEVLYFWSRSQSILIKKLAGLVVRIPRFDYLRHKSSPPFANRLKDHVFVVMKLRNQH